MDAIAGTHQPRHAILARKVRGIAALFIGSCGTRIDERHIQFGHQPRVKRVQPLYLGIIFRIAHHRQAHPYHAGALGLQRLHITGDARRDFGLPARRQQGRHLAIHINALGVVGAETDHRHIHWAFGQDAGQPIFQIVLGVTGEAGGLFGMAQHLKGFAARQLVIERRPQAITETVAKHADAERALFGNGAGQASRHVGRCRHGLRQTIDVHRLRRSGGCHRYRRPFGHPGAQLRRKGQANGNAGRHAAKQHGGAIDQQESRIGSGRIGHDVRRSSPRPARSGKSVSRR